MKLIYLCISINFIFFFSLNAMFSDITKQKQIKMELQHEYGELVLYSLSTKKIASPKKIEYTIPPEEEDWLLFTKKVQDKTDLTKTVPDQTVIDIVFNKKNGSYVTICKKCGEVHLSKMIPILKGITRCHLRIEHAITENVLFKDSGIFNNCLKKNKHVKKKKSIVVNSYLKNGKKWMECPLCLRKFYTTGYRETLKHNFKRHIKLKHPESLGTLIF